MLRRRRESEDSARHSVSANLLWGDGKADGSVFQLAAELVVPSENEARGRSRSERGEQSAAATVGQRLEPAAHERSRTGGRVPGNGYKINDKQIAAQYEQKVFKRTSCDVHPSISLFPTTSHSVCSPPVWLHHHLRGCVPAGAPAGSAQQHYWDPPGRLQVRHSVEETHAGPSHRHRSASSPHFVHLSTFRALSTLKQTFSIVDGAAICRWPLPHMNMKTHMPAPAMECMATWLSWRYAGRLEERIKKMLWSWPAKANWPRRPVRPLMRHTRWEVFPKRGVAYFKYLSALWKYLRP